MKVWEETWDENGDMPDWSEHNNARAKLAACAPEMARMLLAVEWKGDAGDWGPACPFCHALEPGLGNPGSVPGHRAGCELNALLKKAGVR